MNCVSCDICVYHLWFVCVFSLGVFLSTRVTGACHVTTDLIMRVSVRKTTATTTATTTTATTTKTTTTTTTTKTTTTTTTTTATTTTTTTINLDGITSTVWYSYQCPNEARYDIGIQGHPTITIKYHFWTKAFFAEEGSLTLPLTQSRRHVGM